MSLPPPPASDLAARRRMQANRSVDTTPEMRLRSALHARGLRYRTSRRIATAGRSVRPDIVFGRARVAVFVDGCFWHRCPDHSTHPKANADYWQEKFERNVARDHGDDAALAEAGWAVMRIWEHEDAAAAADRVQRVLRGTAANQQLIVSGPLRR